MRNFAILHFQFSSFGQLHSKRPCYPFRMDKIESPKQKKTNDYHHIFKNKMALALKKQH
jgi:hypothetical protein